MGRKIGSLSRFVLEAAGLAVFFSGQVEAAVDYSTWIRQTKSDDPASTEAYQSRWAWYGSGFWSDSASPSAGKSYYVPDGVTNCVPPLSKSGGHFFAGDALAVAGVFSVRQGNPCQVPELRLLPGACFLYSVYGAVTNRTESAKLIVDGTWDNPAVMLVDYKHNTGWCPEFKVFLGLESDEDGVLVLDKSINSQDGNKRYFLGDNSAYEGTIVFRDADASVYRGSDFATVPGRLAFACQPSRMGSMPASFAGTVVATEGCRLDAKSFGIAAGFGASGGGTIAFSDDVEVDRLIVEPDSTLEVEIGHVVTVRKGLAVAGGTRLIINGLNVDAITNGIKRIPFVRLTGDAAAATPSLEGMTPPTVVGALPRGATLSVVDAGDDSGDKLVVYTWTRPVVANTGGGYDDESKGASWVTNPQAYWSDGQDLHDGVDYLVYGASGTLLQNGHSIDFGDYPLTLAGDANVSYNYVTGSDISYVCPDGVSSITWGCYGSIKKVFGSKTTIEGTWVVKGYGNCSATFSGVLLGTGTVNIDLYSNNNTSNPIFSGYFKADASDFGGRILINTPRVGAHEKGRPPMPDYDKDYVGRASVSESKNLGGVFRADGDGSDALTVKNSAELIVQGDVDYSEPTRGVLVVHQGNFKVSAGKTFKIRNRVTYAGEFVKRGPGSLALGGTALFSTGSAPAEPSDPACTNKLTVKEGSLEILAGTATDGLEITFESGTAFVLNGACAGGLRSVRPGSSVAIADDKLPVSFADGFVPEKADRKAVALATLASESEAAALAAKLQVPERLANVGKLAGELEVVANGDDTWTVQANYERRGLLIVIR